MSQEIGGFVNDASSKSGKGRIQVSLLDDTVVAFDVESRAKGEELYQKVNNHLKVEEAEYFGLQFYDNEGNVCWLDSQKQIGKQAREPSKVTFKFRVMFYTPDPNSLQEYTRYLFTLQIRRDLLDERLHCTEDTVALLASYIVQGELGDYDPTTHPESYLSGFQFVPNQSPEVEEKIIKYHMSHRGKSPSDADKCMLDIARQLEMYGITLYPAKDRDDTDLSLSVFNKGILVFQNQSRINMFSWAKIRKLSFKKKKFIIKLHPGVYTADLVEFTMQSRDACKGFWKICLAHHIFFRQQSAAPKRRKSSLFSRGSKYRYSGRTQKQLVEESRDAYKPTDDLERNRSSRAYRSSDVQSPVASMNSSEMPTFCTTPPPSYTSFKSVSYPVHKQSNSSSKQSMNVSEDEGSFVLHDGSRKSSQQFENTDGDGGNFEEQNVIKFCRQDTSEESPDVQAVDAETDHSTVPAVNDASEETPVLGRERTESDIDIERQVSSLIDQIKGETTWQYHLTSPDLDEKSDSPIFDEQSPIHDEAPADTGDNIEVNGDVNANETDDVIVDETDELAIKPKDLLVKPPIHYDSDSGGSGREQDEDGAALDEELQLPGSKSGSLSNGIDEPDQALTQPYYIAKEILLTERTYIKDLEVITVSFRDVVTSRVPISDLLSSLLFENIDPLYDFHCSLLAELEDRLTLWANTAADGGAKNWHKIGDIMQANMKQINILTSHIQKHEQILVELEKEMKRSGKLSLACKEFELNKVCYLPLNTFLLKPAQRLLYYKSILGRLYKEYGVNDLNYQEAKSAFDDVFEACKTISKTMINLENLNKMVELDRDLIGVEDIVHPSREFIREGCLYKVCKKGPQPRMFFLFSDTLLYTTQGVTSTNQFRVRSQIPLHLMQIEEGGVDLHGLYAFTIHSKNSRSFVVAATSPEERAKWIEDLSLTMAKAKSQETCSVCKSNRDHSNDADDNEHESLCISCKENSMTPNSLPNGDASQRINREKPPPVKIKKPLREPDSDDEANGTIERVSSLDRRHAHVRTMSTRRVCWHRNTSISMNEYATSVQNNFSGELYRKLKNSSQWQKLWVVFTNFSLFFFKSYEEDEPLASLPLIGYSVSRPANVDEITEDWVFKLQFKTHTYFFKAESEYAFDRWMEVLSSATKSASRTRIFSRLTSN